MSRKMSNEKILCDFYFKNLETFELTQKERRNILAHKKYIDYFIPHVAHA